MALHPAPGLRVRRFPSRALGSPAVTADRHPPCAPEPGCARRLLPALSPRHPSHHPAFLPGRCPRRPSLLSALSSRVSVAERVLHDLWSAVSSLPFPGHLPDGDLCCDLSWTMRPAVCDCPRRVPAMGLLCLVFTCVSWVAGWFNHLLACLRTVWVPSLRTVCLYSLPIFCRVS